MKRSFPLFGSLLFSIGIFAQQVPWTPGDNSYLLGAHTVTAPFELHSPLLTSSVNINGNTQVDYFAGDRVHLNEGFHAGGFTGGGYFHAQIGADADFDVVFIEPNAHLPNVGQFEKLEMGINLPAALQQDVDQWIASNYASGKNPFDPEQISVEAVFTQGANSYTVYGFYYKDFIRDPATIGPVNASVDPPTANWIAQPTPYEWRIRFAPPALGPWHCTISIRVNNASGFSYQVPNVYFTCVPSDNPGWLEVGQDNWHLRTSGTKESFFVLGQNIAWNDNVVFRGKEQLPFFHPGGFMDILDYAKNLADNNGNMVRLVIADQSFEFEWEHLNNYYERLNRCWELDRMFDLCEDNALKLFICLEYGKYNTGTPGVSWNINPYNLEIGGITYVDDFLTDAVAKKEYKKRLRYFLARWGYSTSLGVTELTSEMDLWSYSYITELKNNGSGKQAQYDWHNEMLSYIKSSLHYRPALTSTCYGSGRGYEFNITPFSLSSLDITTCHAYYGERKNNIKRFDDFNRKYFKKGTHTLWNKPTVFDEFGYDHISGDPVDQTDAEGCSDLSFHNGLWATSMMGGIGTGLSWWQWFNNTYRQETFPALYAFFNSIDFENENFVDPDFWDDDPFYDVEIYFRPHLDVEWPHEQSTIETYYNRSDNKNRVIGWVHNTSYWWGNVNDNCFDRNNNQPLMPEDDDALTSPAPLSPTKRFEVRGLNNLANYSVVYFLTRNSGGVFTTHSYQSNIFGTLKPNWIIGESDWAFKGYRAGNSFRITSEITYDTLECGQDTIVAMGNYEFDSLGNYYYNWNFGNGYNSNRRIDTAIYSSPGTYLVTLIVSDTLGFTDTLRQYIVIPNCESLRQRNNSFNSPFGSRVFPNPANDRVYIVPDTTYSSASHISLFTLDGKVVQSFYPYNVEKIELNTNDLSNGVYIIIIEDGIHKEVFRISIVH
jgi:hypothetical protein